MFSIVIFLNELEKNENPNKYIASIFKAIKKQKESEIIFVLNGKNAKLIDEIQKYENTNKSINIKYLFTSKLLPFNKYIQNLNDLISTDFFIILSYPSQLSETSIQTIVRTIKNNEKVDIIEFKPVFNKILNWKPKSRLSTAKQNKLLKINENPEIIAFSFPFIYNKVISTNILNKIVKMTRVDEETSSNIFFSSCIYSLLLSSSKYIYVPQPITEVYTSKNNIMNYKDVLNQWKIIENIYQIEKKYIEEISYAKYYYLKIILCIMYSISDKSFSSLLGKNENKVLQKKYFETLKIIDEEYSHFSNSNKYMIPNEKTSKETTLLRDSLSISKWSKLSKELES